MRTSDFDFALPNELIAQNPTAVRDHSRLLVLDRVENSISHRQFSDLPQYLRPGDALVLNDSRVIPARLHGTNEQTGGIFEILLLEEVGLNDWWAMVRPGKRARIGTRIRVFEGHREVSPLVACVIQANTEGHRRLRFEGAQNILEELGKIGETPVPPYIHRPEAGKSDGDRERYQTIYANSPGSVAAPTAGLHFTEALLDQIRSRQVKVCCLTLHVGLGTFASVKTEMITAHKMHSERFSLSTDAARTINETKRAGGRIIAVGTTTVRVLESNASQNNGTVYSGEGRTNIFIYPPRHFKVVDALLTNFHLPRSTLLMLVSAFAVPGKSSGRELILGAYAEAIRRRYRFFSYGDAMLLL